MNKVLILSLFGLLFLLNSCQTTKEYGSRYSRYSDARIAGMDYNSPTKKKSRRSYSTKDEEVITRKATSVTSNELTTAAKSKGFKKVKYHSERNSILREAQKYKGIPYLYGGKKPKDGFDCSGFVSYVFQKEDIEIKGNASSLSRLGEKKNADGLNPGDLVFFGENGIITHVGIVTMNDGNNLTMIHSSSSAGITQDNIYHSNYWNKRLMFGVDILSSYFEENLGMN